MKCCGNCFWSFNQEDENFLEEYDEFDANIPQAGDCCIGQDHGGSYCCPHHSYIEGMEDYENYVVWDEAYFGNGYLIVSKLDDEIVKFIKIGEVINGFPQFYIRAYEKDSFYDPKEEFRKVEIKVNKNEPLYNVLVNFANALNGNSIYSIDSSIQGANHLSVKGYTNEASIIVNKDVYGVRNSTDFVDILIGDKCSCAFYDEFLNFYNNLSTISVEKSHDKDIKQLLLKNKKAL